MKVGLAATVLCLATFWSMAALADDDKFCESHVLRDDAGLHAPLLGGSIVRPPMVEHCSWGRGFISPSPTVEFFSSLHLTNRKLCKFASYNEKRAPTGKVFIRGADPICPAQTYASYTATRDVSDEEYAALLDFWCRLRLHPAFSMDAIFSHFDYRRPDEVRAFLFGFQQVLPQLLSQPRAMEGHWDTFAYKITSAEKAQGIYLIVVGGGYELVLVRKGNDFEIIGVERPIR